MGFIGSDMCFHVFGTHYIIQIILFDDAIEGVIRDVLGDKNARIVTLKRE